jgi:uncharacterized protein YjbI with pentapeptide repeats
VPTDITVPKKRVIPTTRRGLTRKQVEESIKSARRRRRPPSLSGKRMWGDYSGVDFTSSFQSSFSSFTSEILGADFRNAKLARCNLSKADLASANLRGTDLRGARLTGANLYTSLLQGSDLTDADLSFSNLQSAELESAIVERTNFSGAYFGSTAIGSVDLSAALGLDEAIHRNPSPIGGDTLRLTAAGLGKRPEYSRRAVLSFLRNAGIHDDLLSVVRSWIGTPIEFYSVFLSHSSLDKDFARKLYADLRALGVNCWFDEKQILPGDNILEIVDQGIKKWDKFVLVCSSHSLSRKTGWWVEQELERAFAKERELRRSGRKDHSVLIPITIDDFIFDKWASGFKASVIDKHVGDFRNWEAPQLYAEAVDRLRRAIDAARK